MQNYTGGLSNPVCLYVPTDVTQSGQITHALDIGERIFGKDDNDDGVVNTVVNCAGIVLAGNNFFEGSSTRLR